MWNIIYLIHSILSAANFNTFLDIDFSCYEPAEWQLSLGINRK